MKKLLTFLTLGAIVVPIVVFCVSFVAADIPHLINYQGMLTESDGTSPVEDGTYNLGFKIYGSESGTDSLWWEYHSNVQVTHGLFNVILGSVSSLDLPFDTDYWLEIKVGAETMPNRLRFTSVGYAYRARWAGRSDTADYALSSPSGPGDYTWTFRITDGGDTTITTGGGWGIARFGNVLYGNADSTHVNLGVACTTGTSGQNYKYCTVGGGLRNTASGDYATVGGGFDNTASGTWATVGGGRDNTASGYRATVGGGSYNTASGDHATVGGGSGNSADTSYATVGGGINNLASGYSATVGGGVQNSADTSYATVGGGYLNTASGCDATVGGGYHNTADMNNTTVGGGYYNEATGPYATVAGGCYNTASGDYSFAAGNRAKANHTGAFVWADGSVYADFASTGNNQFLIRASGGVGIGVTNPEEMLEIENANANQRVFLKIQASHPTEFEEVGIRLETPQNRWHLRMDDYSNDNLPDTGSLALRSQNSGIEVMTWTDDGNVGIGTTSPEYRLDVAGQAHATSFPTSSDVRLKKNVHQLTDVLEKLEKIRGVAFDWNERYESLGRSTGHREIGVIAQEVEAVFPELVTTWGKEEYMAVDYGRLTGVLIEAIKELRAENDQLKKRVQALETK